MNQSERELRKRIEQSSGAIVADLVIRNASIFDLVTGDLLAGDIAICGDTIVGVGERYDGAEVIDGRGLTAVPGFIDTHVHVESSLLTPFEFERMVLPRGVTTAICDPHELANVAGVAALEYFFGCSERMAMDLFVQLSSCVPATGLETSGAKLSAADLRRFMDRPDTLGLAEMMNIPELLAGEPELLSKLALFQGRNIDGHCPLISGKALNGCIAAGLRNCHETSSVGEGWEKLRKGMTLLIREGSAARNLEGLIPLLSVATSPFIAFCTDDRNPLDVEMFGHVDYIVRRALELGCSPLAVYRASSWSGARAFRLFDRGLVAPGYKADIVLIDDLGRCGIRKVLKSGRIVNEKLFASRRPAPSPEAFLRSIRCEAIAPEQLAVHSKRGPSTPVIEVGEGSILTGFGTYQLKLQGSEKLADPEHDVLKCVVAARYGSNRNIGVGFVHGFGLRRGAIASSVGHDSHNLCAVGVNDSDIACAINALVECGGGFAAVADGKLLALLPLPVGGLMSDRPGAEVAAGMHGVLEAAKALGCPFGDPFQTLAFLPLPVIPHLRLTDRGVVDVVRAALIEI